MPVIIEANPQPRYRLHLRFSDGVEGEVDLSHLVGRGVFRRFLEAGFFEQARVGDHGDVQWPGEIDLCPDALYLQVTGRTVAQVFPNWPVEAEAVAGA